MRLKNWWGKPWLRKWVTDSDVVRELWQEDRLNSLHARIMLAVEKVEKDKDPNVTRKTQKPKRRPWRGANPSLNRQ